MNGKPQGKQPPNPAAAFGAPGLSVPNNPKNFQSFGPSTGAAVRGDASTLLFATPYGDGVVGHPDALARLTPAQQQVIATGGLNGPVGAPRPFDPAIGDTSGTQLPVGFPDGGPLARMTQRGTSTSPSMTSGGPRRNEPPPRASR